jgi:hypothetical protein
VEAEVAVLVVALDGWDMVVESSAVISRAAELGSKYWM